MLLELTVNGQRRSAEVEPLRRLLDVLREELALTGTKEGCGGEGECAPVPLWPDGALVNSCLVAACQVSGSVVVTVEGVADGERLAPVQRCFLERGGAPCGICTPGMVVRA